MEDVQEISNCNGKSVVTFTLTLPSQINSADLVSLLRQTRSEKRKLGHDAAADAIGNLLSLAKPQFYYPPTRRPHGAGFGSGMIDLTMALGVAPLRSAPKFDVEALIA